VEPGARPALAMPDELAALRSKISPNHRRVIAVRLRVLEDACQRLLDLFHARESSLTVRVPLPPHQAEDVSRLVRELSGKISGMKSDLTLRHTVIDARREASALVYAMTVDAEELFPRYLRGYGELPPALAKYLESRMTECLRVIEKIHQALGVPAQPPEEE
jgi:hypothetical protein